jgi:hypothetical protein
MLVLLQSVLICDLFIYNHIIVFTLVNNISPRKIDIMEDLTVLQVNQNSYRDLFFVSKNYHQEALKWTRSLWKSLLRKDKGTR